MPIIVVKGLPGDEEDRLAELRLKKKLKAGSKQRRGPAMDSVMSALTAGAALRGGPAADTNAAYDSEDDEKDEDAIYKHAQLLYAHPAAAGGKDAAGAGDTQWESETAAKRRRMKEPMPSAYMTPLVALTDLMTLKVYTVTRQGPWDTAPPVTQLLGGDKGFAGVGEEGAATEDEDFQRHLKDARGQAEAGGGEDGSGPPARSSAAGGHGGLAEELPDPTPLQRLRYLHAKSSYSRSASKDQRLSDLVKVSESRKHAVKQGASLEEALSPRSSVRPGGAGGMLATSPRGGAPTLSDIHTFPSGQLGVGEVSAPYSICSEQASRHGNGGGFSTQSSVTDVHAHGSVYSTTTNATLTAGGVMTHSHSAKRTGSAGRASGSGSGGGAATSAGGSAPGGNDRPSSSESRDSWNGENLQHPMHLNTAADREYMQHDQLQPHAHIQDGHVLHAAQQKRTKFLAALEWALSTTDAHGDTLLEFILSLDTRLQKFAEQKAEAEVWWHKWRKQQQQDSLAAEKPASGLRAKTPPVGAAGVGEAEQVVGGGGRRVVIQSPGTGGSNQRASSPPAAASGGGAVPTPTIAELALFSMKGMRAMIEQEKEADKSQVCVCICIALWRACSLLRCILYCARSRHAATYFSIRTKLPPLQALSNLMRIDTSGLGRMSIRGTISEHGSPASPGKGVGAPGSARSRMQSIQMGGNTTSSATAATSATSPAKGPSKEDAGKRKSLLLQLQALSDAGKDAFLRSIAPPAERRISRSPSLLGSTKRSFRRSSTMGVPNTNNASMKRKNSSAGSSGWGLVRIAHTIREDSMSPEEPGGRSLSPSTRLQRDSMKKALSTGTGHAASGMETPETSPLQSPRGSIAGTSSVPSSPVQRSPRNDSLVNHSHAPTPTGDENGDAAEALSFPASPSGRSRTHVTIVPPGGEEERPETSEALTPASKVTLPLPPSGPPPSQRTKRPPVPTQRHKRAESIVHTGPVQYTSVSAAAEGSASGSSGSAAGGAEKDNDALPAAVKAAQAEAQMRENIVNAQRKSQLDAHQRHVSHVQALAIKAMRKTGTAEVGTARVANKLQSYNELIAADRVRVGQLCSGKEYAFVSRDTLQLKQSLFHALETEREASEQTRALDKPNAAASGKDRESEKENQRGGGGAIQAARDMKIVAKRAKKIRYWVACDRLQNATWIRHFYPAFRDLVRRANMQGGEDIPHSAIRLLSVAQMFVMEDVAIDEECFYIMLEAIVTKHSDHAKASVNRIVGAIRESIQITPQAYLAYLLGKDIIPCPELTGQVRELRKKKERDMKEKERSKKEGRKSLLRRPVPSASYMSTVEESAGTLMGGGGGGKSYTDGGATITTTSSATGLGAGVRTVTSVSSLYSQMSRGELSDSDNW